MRERSLRVAIVAAATSSLLCSYPLIFNRISIHDKNDFETSFSSFINGSGLILRPPSLLCSPDKIQLNCSSSWLTDAFHTLSINHGTIKVTAGASNVTEVKLCSIKKKQTDYYDEKRRLAGVELPTTVSLIKCQNALIEFWNRGKHGQIVCGHPKPSPGSGTQIYDGIEALLASDLMFTNIFQHDVQNGLGHAAAIWNSIKDKAVPNLYVLAGNTVMKEFWITLGADRVIHPGGPRGRPRMWFRTLYTGDVPMEESGQGEKTDADSIIMQALYRGTNFDPMFPCSTYSMEGFHHWRSYFTSQISSSREHEPDDNLLLYLQRDEKMTRSCVFWSCERDLLENSDTCDCQPIPEKDFLERLSSVSDRNGLEMKVFYHSTMKKDAALFARARVVLGPHGGAFTNQIFLNHELNPIIIEANLHHQRTFFSHLAASLGHRHLTYRPSIFQGYDGGNSKVHFEINHYLEFLENTIRGVDTGMAHVNAVHHPCVSFMHL